MYWLLTVRALIVLGMAKQMTNSAKSGRIVAPTVAKAHRAATIKKATSIVKSHSATVAGRVPSGKSTSKSSAAIAGRTLSSKNK
jgi:hypothetical protein